jgi:hypothetical protein
MIHEQSFGMDMKGKGCGLIQGTISACLEGLKKTHEKCHQDLRADI